MLKCLKFSSFQLYSVFLKASDDNDEDFVQHNRSRHDCHPPVRSRLHLPRVPDTQRAPSCLRPLISNTSSSTPTLALDTENYDRNHNKTPFIAATVDPALQFVQATPPVSAVKQQHR